MAVAIGTAFLEKRQIGFVLPKTLVKARSGRGEEADDGEGDLLAALDPLIPDIKMQPNVLIDRIGVRSAKSHCAD